MATDSDIYPVNPRDRIMLNVRVSRQLKRSLKILSEVSGRTETDFIIEGMSIVIAGYKDLILAWEADQRDKLTGTDQEGVQKP